MKKLIFILSLFISTVSFGQTKEETIDWINTYAKANITRNSGKQEISTKLMIEDCKLVVEQITTNYSESNGTHIYQESSNVDLKNVLVDKIKLENNEHYFVIRLHTIRKLVNHTSQHSYTNYKAEQENTQRDYISIFVNEKPESILKAIMHLAKLCGAKEKPKENTF